MDKSKRTKKSKVMPKPTQEIDISQSLSSNTSGITATPTVADADTTVRKPGVIRIAGPVILSWE